MTSPPPPSSPRPGSATLPATRWLHAGESVTLFGPVGVGKTHIAQALGHLAVRQGAQVRFTKTRRILVELAGGHADRTWDSGSANWSAPTCSYVLILDGFAMRQLGAAQADDLYELVSERQSRSLIITSNRAPSDWYPLFPNPVVAESLPIHRRLVSIGAVHPGSVAVGSHPPEERRFSSARGSG
ncbi:ATP-binding protein [Streptomyces sp. NBC_00728]|uniref:ATP-binding protein n=1 Tax=Streptomyces sp. NBC_00728 TaxID=2903676 RepID=UPI003868ABC0